MWCTAIPTDLPPDLGGRGRVDNLQLNARLIVKEARHPDKDIRKAVKDAQNAGWNVERARGTGHRWGTVSCGQGCAVAISGTPRRPGDIAKRIREAIKKCDHDLSTSNTAKRQKDNR